MLKEITVAPKQLREQTTAYRNDGKCDLTPMGNAVTSQPVSRWLDTALIQARENLLGGNVTGTLWAYRTNNQEYLSLDLIDELGGDHAITFQAGHPHNFDPVQPLVPDMAEAIHMAGIVIRALNAAVASLGWPKD
jgi:hypothetical protein